MSILSSSPIVPIEGAKYQFLGLSMRRCDRSGRVYGVFSLAILDAEGNDTGKRISATLDGADWNTFYNAWSNAAGFYDTLLPMLGLPTPTLPENPDADFLNVVAS